MSFLKSLYKHNLSIVSRFVFVSIILLLLFSTHSVHGKLITQLDRLYKAPNLVMGNNYLYIYDRASMIVDIYSVPGYNYLSSFGGRGEGGGEFKFINIFMVFPDYVYVCSPDRVYYFTKQGTRIKERKSLANSGSYVPICERFVYKIYNFENSKSKITFIMADSNFKKEKEIYIAYKYPNSRNMYPIRKTKILMIPDYVNMEVYKDRIYMGDTTKGFFFTVFDKRGNHLYDISIPYQKTPVIVPVKESYINRYDTYFGEKIKRITIYDFPEFFPAYTDFRVADDRIYVLAPIKQPTKDTRQDIYILSLDGKLLKKTSIPYNTAMCYYIQNSKYYYLIDNEDAEKWELHVEEIK